MDIDIYLDIDGVLLANEFYPATHAAEFINYVLTKYPNTTYWLTTHCQGDASRTVRHIADKFEKETVELLNKIKPTSWLNSPLKTDAIDFTRPFLWFDDDLFVKEKETLIRHNVLENWIEVDLRKDPDQLGKFLQSFPIPINLIEK